MPEVPALNSSKLGTRKFWEQFYDKEIDNFENDNRNLGESWFSESDAENKMVEFLQSRVGMLSSINFNESRIGDLGTGNGRLLFALRDAGFQNSMVGMDYSQNAVDLAMSIQRKLGYDNMEFIRWNFLIQDNFAHDMTFNILLDKGTLDAIALSDKIYGENDAVHQYSKQIKSMVRPGGILLITSCNFTQAELVSIIAGDGVFDVYDDVPYPTFRFGGKTGQTVCTVAFHYSSPY